MKRFIALLLCLMLLPLPAAWAEAADIPEGYEEVARTEVLALLFNKKDCLLAVQDLRNGYIFYQAVQEEVLPSSGLTKTVAQNVKSPLMVTYAMLNQNDTSQKRESILAMKPDISHELIDGGIRINFVMDNVFLEISMEVTIEGDALHVTIPKDGIREAVGSSEVVSKRMDAVVSYIQSVEETLSGLTADERMNQKDIKKALKLAKQRHEQVAYLLSQITDALGMEYVVDELLTAYNKMNVALYGGEGQEGLFATMLRIHTGEAEQAEITKVRDELRKKGDTTALQISAMKKIKVAGVVSLEVLPMFGAGGDQEDGYVLYPDGSGALGYFKAEHPKYNEYFSRKVYSDDTIDLRWEQEKDTTGQKRTFLPVFGIRKGSNAFVAAVTKGDADASINYYPSGYQLNLYRASATFAYRRTVQSNSIASFYQGASMTIYDKTRNEYEAQVSYYFLEGDQADYSGMACRYREELIARGLLNQQAGLTETAPMMLDILTGIKKTVMIFDWFVSMTTFEQVGEMIRDLQQRGVDVSYINLHGWTKEGYDSYPTSSQAAKDLGGFDALKDLAAFCKEQNIGMYLQDNYLEVSSKLKDVSGSEYAQETDFTPMEKLLAPSLIAGRYEKALKELEEIPISGTMFERVGSLVYYDYAVAHTSQRGATVESWRELYRMSREAFGSAASVHGNLYALADSDVVMNVPSSSTHYLYEDASVPFYQMVLHGSVAYTGKPFNTFYDQTSELLRAVEYGETPLYRLTHESALELQDTTYDDIFSSAYEDWCEQIAQVYASLKPLGVLNNKKMLHHHSDGVLAVVEYEGGYTLYVNHGSVDLQQGDVTIPAESFVVISNTKEVNVQ